MTIKPSKVALVTGANGGIGLATLRALKDAGFVAVGAARREEGLEAIRTDGFPAVRIDVTDDQSMQEGVAEVDRVAGRIGVLVNNAGYGLAGPVELLDMDDLRTQFETNVFGLVRMCQLVLPAMREGSAGRIINISSVGGELTLPGEGAYHATKYAVESFSDALRVEVGQFGVKVVLVQPTGVRTNFFDTIAATATGREEGAYKPLMDGWRKLFGQVASGPGLVEPEAVARVIVKAATSANPAARYKAGWSAAVLTGTRSVMPDRAWDFGLRKMLGVS